MEQANEKLPALRVIGTIHTDFPTKFGIPRQSGLVEDLHGEVVFTEPYRRAEAVRGLEGFSHIWLLWLFSEVPEGEFSPTVRPPRLGGNVRMGVFATRSPYRPNPIGLSAVRLDSIEMTADRGPVLHVSGADLMDGTPILDVKPYLPYADSVPDALGGFAEAVRKRQVQVEFPEALQRATALSAEKLETLTEILAQDPRPAYQNDPERVYGFKFAGFDVKFKVQDEVLTVIDLIQL